MTNDPTDETQTHHPVLISTLFRWGLWWRIIYGVLRILLALSLLHYIGATFGDYVRHLMHQELIEDPHDVFIGFIRPFLAAASITITKFIAAYLIFWGAVDIFLAINLLRHRLWAFPVTYALIGAFVLYEIYRYFHSHSLILLGVIALDLAVLWIIGQEHHRWKRIHPERTRKN